MNLLDIPTLNAFLLVLFRLSALMLSAPFFGNTGVPARLKIGFALVLALVVYPILPWERVSLPIHPVAFALVVFRELLVGIVIGYASRAVFAGIEMAGHLISFQMGLALATTFDPQSGHQSTVISMLYYWTALMVFLGLDVHHWLLRAIVESYRLIGVGEASFHGGVLQVILRLLGDVFKVAVQVSAPVAVVLFFTNVLLAILGRAMPQMHIFLVGLPLTLGIGMVMMMVSLPAVIAFLPSLFDRLVEDIGFLLRAMAR